MTETSGAPAILKARLRADLTAAMKARDGLTTGDPADGTGRHHQCRGAGTTAKELTDAEVDRGAGQGSAQAREAAEAFAGAGRAEQAAKEEAEAAVLTAYLPTALTDDEVAELVASASTGSPPAPVRRVDHATDGPGHQAGAGAVRPVERTAPRIAAAVKAARSAGRLR